MQLQAARVHAAEMEEQAQEETVGAEEAYLLLGDAEVTVSPLVYCLPALHVHMKRLWGLRRPTSFLKTQKLP